MPFALTEQQWEMLRTVVEAGWCISIVPMPAREVWRVHVRAAASVVRTFEQRTGDALLRRNFIRPDSDAPKSIGPTGAIWRRYVPTGTGRWVAEKVRQSCTDYAPP